MDAPEDHPALELDVRREIYRLIEDTPGIHLRKIQGDLDLPYGTTTYHLRYLEDHDLISSKEDGGYKRYYASHKVGRRDKEILRLLRQEIPRRVCIHLLVDPGQTHGELADEFDVSPSTLSYHMKKLREAEIVEAKRSGRHNQYFVIEPDAVSRLLIAYQPTFVDDVVDRFVDAWADLEP